MSATEPVTKPDIELQPVVVIDNAIKSESHAPPAETPGESTASPAPRYLAGWRLYLVILGLCTSLLLSTLETTIVSTSLVSITNALQGFENRDWVVTSYLLTYTGFLVIYAKFSDIFGSKFMILLALMIFTVFSIACGLANGMTELIIFRALQGVGGSGIYSMVSVIVATIVSPTKFAKYMAIISSVFAVSSVLGPILGGVINEKSTWRWVFLLNPPPAAVATALIVFLLPSSSPNHEYSLWMRFRHRFTRTAFRRLDLLGASLMLVASILLVFALEEAETRYPWKSATILSTLIIGIVSWFAFVQYEVYIERKKKEQEPIFPMRLLKSRVMTGMLLNGFLTGFPFMSVVVNIPQRFQAVNGSSPTAAGVLLLPLLLSAPVASGITGYLGTSLRIPPVYITILGSCLQFLGVGLMCSLSPTDLRIQKQQYAYEVIMGFGFGFVLTSLLTLIPLVVSKKDMPVVIGAVTQVRVLGGTIGLAIGTVVLNSFLKKELRKKLSEGQMAGVGQSLSAIGGLTDEQQRFVRQAFGKAYARQMWVVLGFSGLVVVSSLLIWERKPRRLEITEEGAISEPA